MEVILKFFGNEQDENKSVISRTLGKISIVEKTYMDKAKLGKVLAPKPQEFWRCRIIKELQRGKREGAFLVRPISQVPVDDLLHLVPSMYTSSINMGRMIITPTPEYAHRACILPLDHKHIFAKASDAYCIIVDVTKAETEKQPRYGTDNPYSVKRNA